MRRREAPGLARPGDRGRRALCHLLPKLIHRRPGRCCGWFLIERVRRLPHARIVDVEICHRRRIGHRPAFGQRNNEPLCAGWTGIRGQPSRKAAWDMKVSEPEARSVFYYAFREVQSFAGAIRSFGWAVERAASSKATALSVLRVSRRHR